MARSVWSNSYAGVVAMCACSGPVHEGQTVVLVRRSYDWQGGVAVWESMCAGFCQHGCNILNKRGNNTHVQLVSLA